MLNLSQRMKYFHLERLCFMIAFCIYTGENSPAVLTMLKHAGHLLHKRVEVGKPFKRAIAFSFFSTSPSTAVS